MSGSGIDRDKAIEALRSLELFDAWRVGIGAMRDLVINALRALPALDARPSLPTGGHRNWWECWNCNGLGKHNEALGPNDSIVKVPPYPCPICKGAGGVRAESAEKAIDALRALSCVPASTPSEATTPCINCGEQAGYETNEGNVGAFCPECWDFLRAEFAVVATQPPDPPAFTVPDLPAPDKTSQE